MKLKLIKGVLWLNIWVCYIVGILAPSSMSESLLYNNGETDLIVKTLYYFYSKTMKKIDKGNLR